MEGVWCGWCVESGGIICVFLGGCGVKPINVTRIGWFLSCGNGCDVDYVV